MESMQQEGKTSSRSKWRSALEKGETKKIKRTKEILSKEKRGHEYSRMCDATMAGHHIVEPEVEIPEDIKGEPTMQRTIKENDNLPDTCVKVVGRKEVDDIIIPWCEEHFDQTHKTPLM